MWQRGGLRAGAKPREQRPQLALLGIGAVKVLGGKQAGHGSLRQGRDRDFQRTAPTQLIGDALQGLQGLCTLCKNPLRRVTAGLP